jgi:hypothetical protein
VKFFDKPLISQELMDLVAECGNYTKLTVDIEKGWIVTSVKLHADGEKLLLEKGSLQDNIWGGGLNFQNKQIDATAVLNLRTRLDNDSLEILDPQRREKFINLVKNYFQKLWL